MPNNRNAAKADRQSQKRRLVNRSQTSTLKTLVKKFRTSLTAASGEAAPAVTLAEVSKKLDQAGAKRLIHPKKASRLKSRLTKAQNKMAAAAK